MKFAYIYNFGSFKTVILSTFSNVHHRKTLHPPLDRRFPIEPPPKHWPNSTISAFSFPTTKILRGRKIARARGKQGEENLPGESPRSRAANWYERAERQAEIIAPERYRPRDSRSLGCIHLTFIFKPPAFRLSRNPRACTRGARRAEIASTRGGDPKKKSDKQCLRAWNLSSIYFN